MASSVTNSGESTCTVDREAAIARATEFTGETIDNEAEIAGAAVILQAELDRCN